MITLPPAASIWRQGCIAAAEGNWQAARRCFIAVARQRPALGLARSRAALAAFQLGEAELAEAELRALVRRYPRLAEAHAALAAVLCRRGAIEEACGCWSATTRLDPRYRQRQWLLRRRHWPPLPLAALNALVLPVG